MLPKRTNDCFPASAPRYGRLLRQKKVSRASPPSSPLFQTARVLVASAPVVVSVPVPELVRSPELAPHDGIWPGWSSLPLATTFAVPHQPYNHLSITFAAFGADAVDLLTQLLTYDPAKRMDAASARAHRFLAPDSDPPPRPMRDMPTFSSSHESAGRVGLGGTETTGDWNREDERRGGDEDKSKRAKR